MQRITHATAKNNRFITGTVITNDWLNSIQEEISNVIESENIRLNRHDKTQLNTAIEAKIFRSVDTSEIKNSVESFVTKLKSITEKINNYTSKINNDFVSYLNLEIKKCISSLESNFDLYKKNVTELALNKLNELNDSIKLKIEETANSCNSLDKKIKELKDLVNENHDLSNIETTIKNEISTIDSVLKTELFDKYDKINETIGKYETNFSRLNSDKQTFLYPKDKKIILAYPIHANEGDMPDALKKIESYLAYTKSIECLLSSKDKSKLSKTIFKMTGLQFLFDGNKKYLHYSGKLEIIQNGKISIENNDPHSSYIKTDDISCFNKYVIVKIFLIINTDLKLEDFESINLSIFDTYEELNLNYLVQIKNNSYTYIKPIFRNIYFKEKIQLKFDLKIYQKEHIKQEKKINIDGTKIEIGV